MIERNQRILHNTASGLTLHAMTLVIYKILMTNTTATCGKTKFVRTQHSGQRISKQASKGTIADIYPLTLPKPSSIGESTYEKFLQETKFPVKKQKILDLQQQGTRQILQSRTLKVHSECRAPPTDWEGNILPPANFRKYPRRRSIYSTDDWEYIYRSYTSPVSRKINYTLPNSPYSREGTPWHYGLRGRRS